MATILVPVNVLFDDERESLFERESQQDFTTILCPDKQLEYILRASI